MSHCWIMLVTYSQLGEDFPTAFVDFLLVTRWLWIASDMSLLPVPLLLAVTPAWELSALPQTPVINLHTLTCFLAVERCQDMLLLCLPYTHILCAPELLDREIEREREVQVRGGGFMNSKVPLSSGCQARAARRSRKTSSACQRCPVCARHWGGVSSFAAFTLLPFSPPKLGLSLSSPNH